MTKTPNISAISCMLLALFMIACEEKTDWDLDTNEPKLIVVEGVLTNERKPHEVSISRPLTDPNGIPQPISGAFVAIWETNQSQNDRAHRLREVEPGIYVTDSTVRAVFGRLYTLFILYQGQEYYGSSFLVPVDQLESLDYSKIPGEDFWYELNFKETDSPSMTEIYLNWGHLPGFRNLPQEQTRAKIIYYTVKSIDVNKIFRPAKERVPFPVGTRVYRRQYSMNQWQEDFVRTLMAETEWRGGLFDVQPGNVRTNLSAGAVGYFSVSQVVSDSTIIRPR